MFKYNWKISWLNQPPCLTRPDHFPNSLCRSKCPDNVIAAGSGGDGQPALPEPDGGAAGVPLHHPRQADAALVPRAARLQHHGTQHITIIRHASSVLQC